MNKIEIKGNIGKIQPMRYTAGGLAVLTVSIADNYGKDANKTTQWFDAVFFGEEAENVNTNIVVGTAAHVIGRLEIRTFTRRDGNQGFSVAVLVNDAKFGDDVQWGSQQAEEAEI